MIFGIGIGTVAAAALAVGLGLVWRSDRLDLPPAMWLLATAMVGGFSAGLVIGPGEVVAMATDRLLEVLGL